MSQEKIERGLRVQFFTRREWVGILIGKGGARINTVQKSTGCTITVDDGGVGGGRGRAWRQGSGDRFTRARGAGWAGDLRSSRSARSARVIISGSDRNSVRQAREMMEFSEAMIAVNPTQVFISVYCLLIIKTTTDDSRFRDMASRWLATRSETRKGLCPPLQMSVSHVRARRE